MSDRIFTAEQRAEIERMIAAAAQPSRWDAVYAAHLEGMRHGHSGWIDTGRFIDADGVTHITTLRNPVTGEVVSRDA